MKLLVLYEELAPYFLSCINSFTEKYNCEVILIRKEINAVAPFQFNTSSSVRLIERNKLIKAELNKLATSFSPDAILCGGWANKPYLELCKKYQKKIPVVLGFDNWWNGSLKQVISAAVAKKYFAGHFNRCYVPGHAQKEFALKLGFSKDAINTGAYCCDFKHFNKLFIQFYEEKKKSFPHRFIFSGRYITEKGIEQLWKAFIKIQGEKENDWELWCLGKGEVKAINHPKIKHFGFVQPEEMGNYIRQSGVFILPSTFEPWGVVVHEFAAAGFPLLLSDKVGAAEKFLLEGENGFSFQSGSVEAIYEAMKKIIELSDEKMLEMGKRSNKLAQQITPETWSTTLFELINSK